MSTRKARDRSASAGYYAYQGLDRVLHEKARLGILTALLTRGEGILFTDMKRLCGLTDGNLSRHLQVLVDAGLVSTWKGQEAGRSQTLARLTKGGRRQFLAYLEQLERVIEDARLQTSSGKKLERPPDWVPA